MPREFSEDTERSRPPEIDETHEQQEVDEVSKTAKEIASEASEKLEEQEKVEQLTEDAIKELEELDSNAERAEEIARESVKELEGMEEDLGYKIEEVREELHEEFVNDMKDKLEERSVKETSSESEETAESGEAEETEASSESHIEGSDGMVYVIKTGEVSESKAELEIEESVEPDKEETPEVQQTSEEKPEVAEQESYTKIRNSIVRPEALESEEAEFEQVETPERKKEHTTTEEHLIEETIVDESKREHEEKRVVKESQEIEESSSTEGQEEISEVTEEKKGTEKEHLDTINDSLETSSENEREEIVSEQDEIIEDELAESIEVEDDLELPVELPEEIKQDIEELAEELVEDLESQEEEQVDESRIIVDAMTGKEHIDRSLEYRPYYQETEEGSEQNERENVKEKIDEMFAKLSEEEQEKFKESVRSKLETEEDLDEWVKRNPSVKASPDYKEKYKDAKKYIRGKRKGKVPKLIKELWKDEIERAWTSTVGSIILRSMERLLAKAMKPKGRVVSFDIQQHLNLNKNKGHTINKEFQQSHNLTGKSRNTRYGVINGKLLIWKPNVTPIQLETAYSELYYYFRDKETFNQYIRDVGDSLGIPQENRNEIEKALHELASQMFTEPVDHNFINPRTKRIRGDYVHLMNDISGKTLKDIEGDISRVTGQNGHGGIENPRFPQGEKREVAIARLAGTVLSDCTIEPNGVIKYAESEMSRISIVIENLREFGDINPSSTYIESENHYITHFPFVIGKMMMQRGVPSGDRTIQNPRLIPSVREGSDRVQRACIEDFITQDGCVGDKSVIWRRANALDAGKKAEKYDFESKVGVKEIKLVIDKGRKEKGNASGWTLSWGKLNDLVESSDDSISSTANDLQRIVMENPNKLIHDEVDIVRGLGVKIEVKPSEVKYYPETGRVTTIWQARTTGLKEAIKLGVSAPPNDVIKKEKMRNMIQDNPVKLKEALGELRKSNIEFECWWE